MALTEAVFPERWDLSAYFPSLASEAYRQARQALRAAVDELVAGEEETPLEERLLALESAQALGRHLGSYLGCLVAQDAHDVEAQKAQASLQAELARLRRAFAHTEAQLAALPDDAFRALVTAPAFEEAQHQLGRMRTRGRKAMDPAREALAAALSTDGIHAWGRLYTRTAGQLTFPMRWPDGRTEAVPMAQRRTLMEDGDRALRRAAFVGGNEAWQSVAPTVAAGLNAIVGARLTLQRERGEAHYLDEALRDSDIDRETLTALWHAVEESRPLTHAILQHKARQLGVPRLGWYDLAAPAPQGGEVRIPYQDGCRSILAAFESRYPALARYTRDALQRAHVEAEPRSGKSPGGFCTSSPLLAESRIFMTYQGAPGDVQTLAHELGHAFHNHVMGGRRLWARQYTMTLAETASTFAEQLYTQTLLEDPSTPQALRDQVLDTRLGKAIAFLLDIPMRFRFESWLCEARQEGELGVEELCAAMRRIQGEVFGETMDPDEGSDPYFWASKLHFHLSGISFYNYPYTFGYLFSRGVWERVAEAGDSGLALVEELLVASGQGSAEQVAREVLGVDLHDPAFWRGCIRHIEVDLAQAER